MKDKSLIYDRFIMSNMSNKSNRTDKTDKKETMSYDDFLRKTRIYL